MSISAMARPRCFIRFLRHLLQLYPDKELYVVLDNSSSHRRKKTLALGRQKETPSSEIYPHPCQLVKPNRNLVWYSHKKSGPARHFHIEGGVGCKAHELHRSLQQRSSTFSVDLYRKPISGMISKRNCITQH